MTVLQEKKHESEEEEKEWPQILAIIIGSLAGLTSGLHVAWTSPFLIKIASDENYDINESQASYFTVFSPLGIIVLSPLLSIFNVTDTIGRKRALLLSAIPHSLAWIMEAFSRNLYVLYAARFTVGLGDAIFVAVLPIYVGEITTPKVRGLWGNCVVCVAFFGQFLMNVIGAYCDVQQTSFICLVVPVLFLILSPFVPETPYYDIMKARDEEARKTLRRLRGKQDIEDEFQSLKAAVQRQMSESGEWKEFLVTDSNKKALTAAIFLRVTQVFSGFYVFMSYTQFIFEKSGGNVSKEIASIIYMGLSFIFFTIAAFISDKLGRKKSYIISLSLSSSMILMEALYFYIDQNHPEIDLSSFQWFPLAGMLTFTFVCAFGVGTIPNLMLGELFSASLKVKGMSIVTTLFSLTMFFTNYLFFIINSYTGLCGPFLVFGCCSILAAVATNYIVPETGGKTLEEIQQSFKIGK